MSSPCSSSNPSSHPSHDYGYPISSGSSGSSSSSLICDIATSSLCQEEGRCEFSQRKGPLKGILRKAPPQTTLSHTVCFVEGTRFEPIKRDSISGRVSPKLRKEIHHSLISGKTLFRQSIEQDQMGTSLKNNPYVDSLSTLIPRSYYVPKEETSSDEEYDRYGNLREGLQYEESPSDSDEAFLREILEFSASESDPLEPILVEEKRLCPLRPNPSLKRAQRPSSAEFSDNCSETPSDDEDPEHEYSVKRLRTLHTMDNSSAKRIFIKFSSSVLTSTVSGEVLVDPSEGGWEINNRIPPACSLDNDEWG